MVNAIAVQSGGRVAFGGQFEFVQGAPRRHLARLGADGRVDAGLAADVAGRAFPSIDAIPAGPGDTLPVGGRFTSIGGQSRNRVARLRGERIFVGGFE